MLSRMRRRFSVVIAGLFLLQPALSLRAQERQNNHRELVNKYYIPPQGEPRLSQSDLVKLIEQKVKHVFVIYQENRSFDSYFGTFPGAEGLYSHPAAETPGFTQELINTDGTT